MEGGAELASQRLIRCAFMAVTRIRDLCFVKLEGALGVWTNIGA
jgi:hypothetical protein